MLSSMSISDLRTELEDLRRELDLHRVDIDAKVELYKMKIARVDALQAFINAQFAISKMEQSFNTADVTRNNKSAAKRIWRQKKKLQCAEAQTACPELPPPVAPANTAATPGLFSNSLNSIVIDNLDVNANIEGNQNKKRKRSAAERRNAKRARLLEVKLEDIKQEIE